MGATAAPGQGPSGSTAGRPAGAQERPVSGLWLCWILPPIAVAAAVLWLWLAAEGGFTELGRYTL